MPTCVLMQQSIPHGGTSRKQKPKIKSKIFTFCMPFWYFTFFLTTLFVYPSPPYVMSGRIWFIHLFVCLFLAVQFWTHLIIDHVKSEDTNGISSLLASASVVTIHHAVPDWGKGLRLCTNVVGIYWNQLVCIMRPILDGLKPIKFPEAVLFTHLGGKSHTLGWMCYSDHGLLEVTLVGELVHMIRMWRIWSTCSNWKCRCRNSKIGWIGRRPWQRTG